MNNNVKKYLTYKGCPECLMPYKGSEAMFYVFDSLNTKTTLIQKPESKWPEIYSKESFANNFPRKVTKIAKTREIYAVKVITVLCPCGKSVSSKVG